MTTPTTERPSTGAERSLPRLQQRYRDELVHATDRLQGWAQAYSDLREIGVRRGA